MAPLHSLLPLAIFVWLQASFPCHGSQVQLNSNSNSPDVSYAILIDAGSTGSRMYIYKFHLSKQEKLESVSDVEEVDNSLGKVKPGLSSLNKLDGISEYLEKFITAAARIIPEDKQTSTPFLLLATAGMRLLTEADQEAIMNYVKQVLSSDRSPFLFKEDYVQIISGKEEAIYAWITVNFIQGVLTSKRWTPSWGVLDMGGASTQTSTRLPRKSELATILRLGKKNYKLFAKSYLDMGLARIHDRFLEFLDEWEDKTVDDKGYIKSPCHHKGFSETFKVGGQEMSIIGEPDSEMCRRLIDDMVFCANKHPNQECPFDDQPKLNGKFVAFSAFYTIIERIGAVICEDKPVSIEQIGCAAKKFCSKPYNVVKPIDEGYVKFSCLWGNYVYELLQKGYKMPANKKIFVEKELKGFSLSWIMGAVLYKTDLL